MSCYKRAPNTGDRVNSV